MQPPVNIADSLSDRVSLGLPPWANRLHAFFRHARSVQVSAGMLRMPEVHIGQRPQYGWSPQAGTRQSGGCLPPLWKMGICGRLAPITSGRVRVSQRSAASGFTCRSLAGVDNIPHRARGHRRWHPYTHRGLSASGHGRRHRSVIVVILAVWPERQSK